MAASFLTSLSSFGIAINNVRRQFGVSLFVLKGHLFEECF